MCEFTFEYCLLQQALYKFIVYEVLLWVIVLPMVLRKRKKKQTYLRSDKAVPLLESAVADLNGNGPVSTVLPGLLYSFILHLQHKEA